MFAMAPGGGAAATAAQLAETTAVEGRPAGCAARAGDDARDAGADLATSCMPACAPAGRLPCTGSYVCPNLPPAVYREFTYVRP